MRIGFIGTENSHVEHFIRFLNSEKRHPGVRAVALVGGRCERNLELAAAGNLNVIVDRPADLIGEVDAAIVSSRDGALHLDHARPLLEAGIPVLIDKPLAASVTDARELLEISQRHDARLVSYSALRFVPELTAFTLEHPERSGLRHLHVVGPADPDSPYSGLFFYGIHHVEAALEILGNPAVEPGSLEIAAKRRGNLIVASCLIADTEVTFTFLVPGSDHRPPFHVTGVFDNAVVARNITLGPDYNAPALAAFLQEVKRDATRLSPSQLLSPISITAAIESEVNRK